MRRSHQRRAADRDPRAALLALLLLPLLAACGDGYTVSAETDTRMARAELIPTFTPLPPATATITPIPSATATQPYVTATPDEFEAAGLPIVLEIPAIGVRASIEHVGRTPEQHVDVPKIPANVAWFNESALPGQNGKPAFINGHLDSAGGIEAVFFELRDLIPGDELAVTYENGDRHVFVVETKERYTLADIPYQRLYGAGSGRYLNLMTCDGAWDGADANYEQRLVIYTRYKGRG
jgi:hypothetical protein